MKKTLLGLIAALLIAAGGYFGFQAYVQHRATAEVDAAFEQIRSAGGKASHGKVSYDIRNRTLTIADIVRHPTARAIAAASLLEAQPMCADCWNKPFCGISPVSTYVREGDLFGQRPRSFECKDHIAVARTLFGLLANESDRQATDILEL